MACAEVVRRPRGIVASLYKKKTNYSSSVEPHGHCDEESHEEPKQNLLAWTQGMGQTEAREQMNKEVKK